MAVLATELLWGEGRKTTGGGWPAGLGQLLGCTVLGLWALGKRQVLTLSLFSYFSIFLQLCGFIKNTKSIPKIMQLLMTTVRNISYSKHFSLGLFEHLKYFIVFKCPNANK